MVKQNMIFLENGRVSVLRHFGEKMEFIKKDGEIDFPITVDFWKWWKRASSFVEGDQVDFCLIYDKEYDLLSEEEFCKMQAAEETIWDLNYVKNFFWELKPTYFSVLLIGQNNEECILSGSGKNIATQKRFFTNLVIPENYGAEQEQAQEQPEEGEKEDTKASVDEKDISAVARYFVELIKKERGQ